MIDPGILNRRLVLEAPVEAPDGQGGVTRSFESVATLWASVVPVGARNAFDADAAGVDVTHRVVLRRNPGITPRHRFRDGTTIYRIVALRERDARQFLQIDVVQRLD